MTRTAEVELERRAERARARIDSESLTFEPTALDAQVLYADPEPYLYQTPALTLIHGDFDDHHHGRLDAMLAGHARLEPLRRVYGRWIQIPLMLGQSINAALKHWCHRLGLAAGQVRRPLRALAANQRAEIDADLNAAFAAVHCAPRG